MDWEILQSGEGEDVEQWLELEINLLACDCFLVSTYFFFIHSLLSIYTHHNKIVIKHLNSYLEESRGEIQSPSREIRLQVLF